MSGLDMLAQAVGDTYLPGSKGIMVGNSDGDTVTLAGCCPTGWTYFSNCPSVNCCPQKVCCCVPGTVAGCTTSHCYCGKCGSVACGDSVHCPGC